MTENRPSIHDFHLSELLNGDRTFMVPTYQRDYAWQEEQIEALKVDLEEYFKSQDNYYLLGQIIIAGNQSGNAAAYKYSVVDGQQRLTTLMLLFQAFKSAFSDHGIGAGPANEHSQVVSELDRIMVYTNVSNGNTQMRFLPCPAAQPIYQRLFDNEVLADVQPNNSSIHIKENFENLSSWVRDIYNTPEKLAFAAKRLLYTVFLATVTVDSEAQALSVFEKINNRGMPLNSSDLMKYLLFQDAPAVDFESINTKWGQAGEVLFGSKPNAIASVQYLMQALLQPETGAFVSSKDVHRQWKEIFLASPSSARFKAGNFVEEILSSANSLSAIAKPQPNTYNHNLRGAVYFNAVQHYPVVLEAWKTCGENQKLYQELCSVIDARVVLALFASEGSQYLNTVMWKWSKAIRDCRGSENLLDFIEAFGISQNAFEPLFGRVRANFDYYDYKNSKDKKRIRYALALIANSVEQKARREDANSTLFELLKPPIRTNTNKYDLDHVFASSLVSTGTYDASWGRDWVDRIGNLTLLHQSDNRSASTVLPQNKSNHYAVSKLLLTQMLAAPTDAPALAAGEAYASRVANLLRTEGAQDVSVWNPEIAEAQTEFYFKMFKSELLSKLGL